MKSSICISAAIFLFLTAILVMNGNFLVDNAIYISIALSFIGACLFKIGFEEIVVNLSQGKDEQREWCNNIETELNSILREINKIVCLIDLNKQVCESTNEKIETIIGMTTSIKKVNEDILNKISDNQNNMILSEFINKQIAHNKNIEDVLLLICSMNKPVVTGIEKLNECIEENINDELCSIHSLLSNQNKESFKEFNKLTDAFEDLCRNLESQNNKLINHNEEMYERFNKLTKEDNEFLNNVFKHKL